MRKRLTMLVRGKRVALVCRAGYLATSGLGSAIDAADVVMRVNWRYPITADPVHVGARTDAIYHGLRNAEEMRAYSAQSGIPAFRVDKDLRCAMTIQAETDPQRLRPTTGLVAIADLLRCGAREVLTYGLDCYASDTYADTGEPWVAFKEHSVGKSGWTHSAALERTIAAGLVTDPRVVPDARLTGVLATEVTACA